MGLIYKHSFENSDYCYIGKTVGTMKNRLKAHIKSAEDGSELIFARAIRKYGKDNIISEIIEDNIDFFLSEKEIYYIDLYDSYINGYNMTPGGEGLPKGYIHSEARNKKISIANKGRVHSDKSKKNFSNGQKGKIMDIEVKTKISESLKGKSKTEEHKNSLRKPKTEEHKNNMKLEEGKIHHNSKSFSIYDSLGELVITSSDTMQKICKLYGYPYMALKESRSEDGKPIYGNLKPNSLSRITKSGNIKFKGWRAEFTKLED